MAGNGYSFVTDRGFGAFAQDLEAPPWKDISIKKYDAGDAMAKAALAEAPMVVAWKLRVTWGIRALAEAVGADALTDLDGEWDSAQRAFNLGVAAAEEHRKPEVRAAAGRVRAALLSGGGTAQTGLSFEQEVDFGRNQVKLAGTSPLSEDIALISAGDHIKRIKEATEALARGIGRDSGKGRSPARARRIRDAVAACSAAFNAVHDDIVWAIEHTDDLQERARLEKLLAPLRALLDRYPATTTAPAMEEVPKPPTPA